MPDDRIKIEVESDYDFSTLANHYAVETKGNILMSDVIVGKVAKNLIFTKALEDAYRSLAKQITDDLIKGFKEEYKQEITKEVKQHLKDNKDVILAKIIAKAKKDAEERFEDAYEDYDY